MPTTITVVSWNVETLGDAKTTAIAVPPQNSEIIPFVASVIRWIGADLVGLMEIRSGLGSRIRDWLVTELNNTPGLVGAPWQGSVSSRQDGGTCEEYVYLWKEVPGRLVLDRAGGRPAPTSLVGVVDDNLLAQLSAAHGWTAPDRADLYAALEANGYISHAIFMERRSGVARRRTTATWRMDPDEWNRLQLAGNAAEVRFDPTLPEQPPAPLADATPAGTAAREALAQKLIDTDILRFTTLPDRSPFLASFLVGAAAQPLSLAMLHAPGPGRNVGIAVGPAINVIGLSRPLADAAAGAGNVLVMGDFNVKASEMYADIRSWGRVTANGTTAFVELRPVQYQPIFGPVTGAPLNTRNLMSGATLADEKRTSMAGVYLPDATPENATLANAYDKFFFHGAPGGITVTNDVEVMNLVPLVARGSPYFLVDLATSLSTFYRLYCGANRAGDDEVDLDAKLVAARRTQTTCQLSYDNIDDQIANLGAGRPPLNLTRRLRNAEKALNKANDRVRALTSQRDGARDVARLMMLAGPVFPTGNGTAAAMLNYAVSDHAPIAVQLTAP